MYFIAVIFCHFLLQFCVYLVFEIFVCSLFLFFVFLRKFLTQFVVKFSCNLSIKFSYTFVVVVITVFVDFLNPFFYAFSLKNYKN